MGEWKTLITCGLLGLALTGPALHAAPERKIEVRGVELRLGREASSLFLHSVDGDKGAKGAALEVKKYLNHEAQELTVWGEQVIFTVSPERSSIDKPAEVRAEVQVPAAAKRGIFLFHPLELQEPEESEDPQEQVEPEEGSEESGEEGEEKVETPRFGVRFLADDRKSFPPGSHLIVNLCDRPLKITLEDKEFEFAGGEVRAIEDPPVGERSTSSMKAFLRNGEDWEPISSSSWTHPGTRRGIQVFYKRPGSTRYMVSGIRDVSKL